MTQSIIINAIVTLLLASGSAIFAIFALSNLAGKRVKLHSRKGLVMLVIFFLGIAGMNFFIGVCFIQGSVIGGDALRGKMVGDHYYLGNHGKYVEVSHVGYWLSFWYTLLSGIAFAAPFVILPILGMLGARRSRDNWLDRVRSLSRRNDLESLYGLIEMIDRCDDSGRGDSLVGMLEPSDSDHAAPSSEGRRMLCEAIRKKVNFIEVECSLPLSECAPVEVLKEQREMWYQWVRFHEDLFRKARS